MSETAFDPMKFYLSLEGRVGRADYWRKLALPIFVASIVISVATRGSLAVSVVFNLLILWPSIVVTVKRWHDRDKSGWWTLIVFVPILGWLWALVENGFLEGTTGDNRFGPAPV